MWPWQVPIFVHFIYCQPCRERRQPGARALLAPPAGAGASMPGSSSLSAQLGLDASTALSEVERLRKQVATVEAEREELKQEVTYLERARACHPDSGGSNADAEAFKRLSRAWDEVQRHARR